MEWLATYLLTEKAEPWLCLFSIEKFLLTEKTLYPFEEKDEQTEQHIFNSVLDIGPHKP